MNTVLSDEQIKAIWVKINPDLEKEAYTVFDGDRQVAKSQDAFTRSELAKAVREMIKNNPYDVTQCSAIGYKHDGYSKALQAVLKVMGGENEAGNNLHPVR